MWRAGLRLAYLVPVAVCCLVIVMPAGAQTPDPGNKSAGQGGACASDQWSEQPLPPEQLPGPWIDVDTGLSSVIESAAANNTTDFLFKGKHHWEGSLASGKLTFKRKPAADEMSETAPEWARKQVAGTLEWSLELEAKLRVKCGGASELVLQGQWFPGELKFVEETDASGKITKQEASVIGKGEPIEVKWRAPNAQIQLLAQTVVGPIHVTRFFYDVPTIIEAVFDQPLSDSSVPVTVTIDGKEQKLTARRDATDYRRFATETVLPVETPLDALGRPKQ
ncbi:MAG TPA: hypothetical protein VGU20_08180 [Stellaceae bacterium]|nr:hypothetical protein [Stellaceae bacterium]